MSVNVPTVQKAAVFSEVAKPIEISEISVPEPSSTELLVKTLYSGLGQVDLDLWSGDYPMESNYPRVGGHSGVGVVVKVGENVPNFMPGDKAGIKLINSACHCCKSCKRGFEAHCLHSVTTGFQINGTFQQYAIVKYSEAVRIPSNIPLPKVVPILSAGVTVYRALKEASVKPGEIIAITSASGPHGSLAIQYAKAMGMQVLAIDSGKAAGEICKDLGATFYVDAAETNDLVGSVLKQTDDSGPHGVLCIDTSGESIDTAAMYVRTQGTIVLMTLPKDDQIKTDVFWTVFRGLTIKGSFYGNRQDGDEALDFVARGIVNVQVEVQPMQFLPKLCEQLRSEGIPRHIVIDNWK